MVVYLIDTLFLVRYWLWLDQTIKIKGEPANHPSTMHLKWESMQHYTHWILYRLIYFIIVSFLADGKWLRVWIFKTLEISRTMLMMLESLFQNIFFFLSIINTRMYIEYPSYFINLVIWMGINIQKKKKSLFSSPIIYIFLPSMMNNT